MSANNFLPYEAFLKNGKKINAGNVLNDWQAFFCANVDHPGEVIDVEVDRSSELPEFLKEQAI